MPSQKQEDRAFVMDELRKAYADSLAHQLAHDGPYAATIAGAGRGSECCQYFARMIAAWRENLQQVEAQS